MRKEQMLIKFNHAFMAYKDFLFNRPNNSLYQGNNITTLLVLFSVLKIILNENKIKTKDENPEEYIDETILEEIVSIISHKEKDKYYLGSIALSSKEEVIKIVRNKIAHGEFYIDDTSENIILNVDNQEIKINSKDFISFTINLVDRINLYTNSKHYNRTQVFSSIKHIKRLKNKRDIDSFLSKIYSLEFSFSDDDLITPQKKSQIEEALKNLPMLSNHYEEITKHDINTDFIKRVFESYGIDVSTKIIPLTASVHYEALERAISQNISHIKALDLQSQIVLISNWFYKMKNDSTPLENIDSGLHYNMYTLFSAENTKYKNVAAAFEGIESNSLFSSLIEMILSNELLGFYIHYHYPLENVFKSKDNIKQDEDYFDYRTLDLSMFEPTIFELPKGRYATYQEAVIASQKRLTVIDVEIKSLEKQLTNIKRLLAASKTPEEKQSFEEVLKRVELKVDSALKKQQNEINNLIQKQSKIDEFDLSDANNYYYNRYLIEYIRNAIAHGNVYFYYSETQSELSKCKLRFINVKDNETLLDLTVSLEDFEKLFNEDNLNKLNEYLHEREKKNRSL